MDLGDSIALAALGAVLTGFGGLVGAFWSHRLEHRKWLRQERLKAWAALQTAVSSTEVPMVELRRSEFSTDGWNSAAERLDDATAELSRAWSEIQLLGPEEILEPIGRYYSAVLRAADFLTSDEDHESYMKERNTSAREFLEAARSWLRSD